MIERRERIKETKRNLRCIENEVVSKQWKELNSYNSFHVRNLQLIDFSDPPFPCFSKDKLEFQCESRIKLVTDFVTEFSD